MQQQLYQSSDPDKIKKAFSIQLKNLEHDNKMPYVLGIPSNCGGGILRGANWGPLFLRQTWHSLHQPSIQDIGDIRVIPHLLSDTLLNTVTLKDCRRTLYQNPNAPYPVSQAL